MYNYLPSYLTQHAHFHTRYSHFHDAEMKNDENGESWYFQYVIYTTGFQKKLVKSNILMRKIITGMTKNKCSVS